MLKRYAVTLYRVWFTGCLYIVAALGYVFYALLWVVRLMQTSRKALVTGVALILAAVAAVLWLFHSSPGDPVDIRITPGQSLRQVTRSLAAARVVPSGTALLILVKLRGQEREVQAGLYTFHRHEGLLAAARKLRHANHIEICVTIPEGLTIEQTAQRVSGVLGIDSAGFASLCGRDSVARSLGITAPSLEGYLFPSTYRFRPGVTAPEVISRMVDQFQKAYAALPPPSGWGERLDKHQMVTLASVVEREATLPQERSRIAGVFLNRLRLGEPLGADPTVRYVLRKFTGPLRVSELRIDSPYNTRTHAGLPPGPICSPGLGSLQAAVSPLETRELYFVAKWDGSGAHDFSLTQREHDAKKLQARRRNESNRTPNAGKK